MIERESWDRMFDGVVPDPLDVARSVTKDMIGALGSYCGDLTLAFPHVFSELEAARATIERVRALHVPVVPPDGKRLIGADGGQRYCAGCEWSDPYEAVSWPCATVRALDGGGDV